jgi:DNA-binding transcriptional regulator YiaG
MTATAFRAALAELGYSQTEFARVIRTEDRTVRRWIAGQSRVPGAVETLLVLLRKRPELKDVLDRSAR